MKLLRVGWIVSLAIASVSASTQAAPVQTGQSRGEQFDGPTGTVTGLVLASDTHKPVRFATVTLAKVKSGDGVRSRSDSVSTFSGPEGNFAIRLPTGDYYVTTNAAGFISTADELWTRVSNGADPAGALAGLPVVHVTEGVSTITVTTEPRGGVISGHVEWEDGTPASGIVISARRLKAVQSIPLFNGIVLTATQNLRTDDQGNFRVTGLTTGDYLLQATTLLINQFGVAGIPSDLARNVAGRSIQLYAPGVYSKTAAKTFSVREGEERTGVRVVIDLRGLHTVSGHAISSNPGETVARGRAQLVGDSDSSINFSMQIDADGGFKVRYVPPGTYTLRITGANSEPPGNFRGRGTDRDDGSSQMKGVAYQDFVTTITMGDTDVTGVAVSLVSKPSQ